MAARFKGPRQYSMVGPLCGLQLLWAGLTSSQQTQATDERVYSATGLESSQFAPDAPTLKNKVHVRCYFSAAYAKATNEATTMAHFQTNCEPHRWPQEKTC
jgi:hypothetical protein